MTDEENIELIESMVINGKTIYTQQVYEMAIHVVHAIQKSLSKGAIDYEKLSGGAGRKEGMATLNDWLAYVKLAGRAVLDHDQRLVFEEVDCAVPAPGRIQSFLRVCCEYNTLQNQWPEPSRNGWPINSRLCSLFLTS
jgi:hypothetical protein